LPCACAAFDIKKASTRKLPARIVARTDLKLAFDTARIRENPLCVALILGPACQAGWDRQAANPAALDRMRPELLFAVACAFEKMSVNGIAILFPEPALIRVTLGRLVMPIATFSFCSKNADELPRHKQTESG
jgi:hypothetical protein